MAGHGDGLGEASVGALLIVMGIVLLIAWSSAAGLITALLGAVGVGGFASGRWS